MQNESNGPRGVGAVDMMTNVFTRRQALQTGAIGGLSLAVPGLVTARIDRSPGAGTADKSCIIVWLCVGPSHHDTWDLKPVRLISRAD